MTYTVKVETTEIMSVTAKYAVEASSREEALSKVSKVIAEGTYPISEFDCEGTEPDISSGRIVCNSPVVVSVDGVMSSVTWPITKDDIIKVCIDLGWAVYFGDDGHSAVFTKDDELGQEFDMDIHFDSVSDIPTEIGKYADEFDVDQEATQTYQWAGTRAAGWNLDSVIESTIQIQREIANLRNALAK